MHPSRVWYRKHLPLEDQEDVIARVVKFDEASLG
jgi:hypothetical protein